MRAHYYYYHQQNATTGIQILKLEIPDLVPGVHDGVAVYYSPGLNLEVLCMAEVGPVLDVNARYIRASEFLSCGPVARSALVAAWPIIGSKLFFEEGVGEDLVGLIRRVCGVELDIVEQRGEVYGEGLVYDWDERVFLGTGRWGDEQMGSVFGGGVSDSSSVGTSLFRYDGFLRGMIVID